MYRKIKFLNGLANGFNLAVSKFNNRNNYKIDNDTEMFSNKINSHDKKLRDKLGEDTQGISYDITKARSYNFRQILSDKKTHNSYLSSISPLFPNLKIYTDLEELEEDYDLTDFYKLSQLFLSRNEHTNVNEASMKKAETMMNNYILPVKNRKTNKKAIGIVSPTLKAVEFYGETEFFFSSEIVNVLWGIKDIDFIHSENYDNATLAHLILHYIDTNNYSELKFIPYNDYTYKIIVKRGSRTRTISKNPITNERANGIINALLYEAGLNIDSQERELRGVIVKELDNGTVRNFRLTTMGVETPNREGVRLSIRKLSSEVALSSFKEFNYNKKTETIFKNTLKKFDVGLLLIGGAVDSGKSTLLYLLSKYCADVLDKDVVMGEAPIEIHLKNASQVDILAKKDANDKIKQTFGTFLKGLLSQAPDVAVLSEVRDEEEISSAVKLPQRGTFCMTTAHGNNNKEMAKRFIKEGNVSVEDFKDVIVGMIHMKLIPKLCPECKGDGCIECENTGFDNTRLPLCEIIIYHNQSLTKDDDIFDYEKLAKEKKAIIITHEEMIKEYIEKGYINEQIASSHTSEDIYDFLGMEDE